MGSSRALAGGLREAGCVVVLNGRAGEGARASSLHAVAFDFTDGDAVGAGVARAEELAGPIDVLVNNAGMQQRASLLDFPVEGWRRMLDTNLTGAYLVGRAVAAGMVARGRGKIDNVCSVQSEVARPWDRPYATTKGALKMLAKGMCADWAGAGLQVNRPRPRLHRDRADPASRRGSRLRRVGARTHASRALGNVTDLVGVGPEAWAILDSNQGPLPYQRSALTD